MRANLSAVARLHMAKDMVKEIKEFDYSKPPKTTDTNLSRQQRRRIKKLEKERQKRLDKLGIKEQRAVITHLD